MIADDRHALMTPEQITAIEVLSLGGTVANAALAANRSEPTIYRWLREDENVRTAVRSATRENMRDSGRVIIGMLLKALAQLDGMLDAKTLDPDQTIRAIDLLARHSKALWTDLDFEERLQRIEILQS